VFQESPPVTVSSTTSPKSRRPDRQGSRRSAARLAAVQAIYQSEMTEAGGRAVATEFVKHRLGREIDGDKYAPADEALFRAVVEGTTAKLGEIDPLIGRVLPPDWPLLRLDAVLRAILRAATWELTCHVEVPVRVIIAEYVDLGHAFFDAKETGLINGVLDRLGRELRPAEWA
jgi:N utilization substance protein B